MTEIIKSRAQVSLRRKRDYIAKRMLETMPKKVHKSKKDLEKQAKYRAEQDPDNDYTQLDFWLQKD